MPADNNKDAREIPSPPMGARESDRHLRTNSFSHTAGEGQDEGDAR